MEGEIAAAQAAEAPAQPPRKRKNPDKSAQGEVKAPDAKQQKILNHLDQDFPAERAQAKQPITKANTEKADAPQQVQPLHYAIVGPGTTKEARSLQFHHHLQDTITDFIKTLETDLESAGNKGRPVVLHVNNDAWLNAEVAARVATVPSDVMVEAVVVHMDVPTAVAEKHRDEQRHWSKIKSAVTWDPKPVIDTTVKIVATDEPLWKAPVERLYSFKAGFLGNVQNGAKHMTCERRVIHVERVTANRTRSKAW